MKKNYINPDVESMPLLDCSICSSSVTIEVGDEVGTPGDPPIPVEAPTRVFRPGEL